jgi:SAM-dependent methyltransferase
LDASECVGVDISENMVGAYNAKAKDLYPETRHAHVGNLLDPEDASPSALADASFSGFDLAGVGAGFHHFDDPVLAAKRLAGRLNPGGVLFILDFKPHAPHKEAHANGVTHHGFSEEQVRKLFEDAGCGVDFRFKTTSPVVFSDASKGTEMTREVFLARGTKA